MLSSVSDHLRNRLICAAVWENNFWPRGYKTFFMFNLAEREIFSADKYENANNSWHFHIY